jgi:hypothetical protein
MPGSEVLTSNGSLEVILAPGLGHDGSGHAPQLDDDQADDGLDSVPFLLR